MKNSETPISESLPQSLWKNQLFWYVLALGFVFGGVFNFLPVSFPVFKQVFGCSLEQLGRTQLIFFSGGLLVSVIGPWFFDRVGLGRGIAATLLAMVISLVLIAGAPNYVTVLLGAAGHGLATYGVLVVGCAIINDRFSARRQSMFFTFGIADALGGTVGAAALGWWLGHVERVGGNWRLGYFAAAGVPIALMIWGMLLGRKIGSSEGASRAAPAAAPARAELRDILKKATIYGMILAMLLHALVQTGMLSWVGQLYQRKLGIDTGQAALFISLNTAGFFAGRSLLVWITARKPIHELLVLGTCATGMTLAFVATLASPSYGWGLVFFTLAGAFASGDAPPVNSYAGRRFPHQSATTFSLLAGASGLGAAVGPYVTGAIGQQLGLERAIWLMPVFGLGLAGLAFGWFLWERAGNKQHSAR